MNSIITAPVYMGHCILGSGSSAVTKINELATNGVLQSQILWYQDNSVVIKEDKELNLKATSLSNMELTLQLLMRNRDIYTHSSLEHRLYLSSNEKSFTFKCENVYFIKESTEITWEAKIKSWLPAQTKIIINTDLTELNVSENVFGIIGGSTEAQIDKLVAQGIDLSKIQVYSRFNPASNPKYQGIRHVDLWSYNLQSQVQNLDYALFLNDDLISIQTLYNDNDKLYAFGFAQSPYNPNHLLLNNKKLDNIVLL